MLRYLIPIFNLNLKYNFKTKREVINFALFFLIIIFCFQVLLKDQIHINQQLIYGILCSSLAIVMASLAENIFQRFYKNGYYETYAALKLQQGVVVLAQWLAFALASVTALMAVMPIALLFLAVELGKWMNVMWGTLLSCIAISTVVALIQLVTLALKRNGIAVAILVLPLLIPILIFGSSCMAGHELWNSSAAFLLGITLTLLPILYFAGGSAIRNTH